MAELLGFNWAALAGCALVTFGLWILALTALMNTLSFPRLGRYRRRAGEVKNVSVLIPARNEAGRIGATLRALLAQEAPGMEVLVLDDHSSDGTAQVARGAAAGDERLRVLVGAELPPGWLGKNWACHQLAQAARGEVLVFTDADVHWSAGGLRVLLAASQALGADMATAWPTQETHTWGERLVVPLMSMAIVAYLPLLAVHHLPWAAFAAANGQCLLFRRAAYERIGGHQAVRDSVIEDVALARRIKAAGLRLRMLDGDGLVGCRMYTDWAQVRDGYAKNILAGHSGSVAFLLFSALAHWAAFILPWAWLGLGWLEAGWPLPAGAGQAWPGWPLAMIGLGLGIRALSAALTRQRVWDALLLPVSVFLMTLIAGRAVYWRFTGGPRWKGRVARV